MKTLFFLSFTEETIMIENEYFIIPKCFVKDNLDSLEELLPLFCFLQVHKGIDKCCMATLKILLEECGYNYENTRRKTYINKIIQSLVILREQQYIYEFNTLGGDSILDIKQLSNQEIFIIATNSAIIDYTGEGFYRVPVDVYQKIRRAMLSREINIGKVLRVYLYFNGSMFHYKQRDKYDGDEEFKTFIEHNPEYTRKTVEKICDDLGKGFSEGTVKKIIRFFHDNEIIMNRPFYMSDSDIAKKPRRIGTLFVQYSDYWEVELDAAAKSVRHYFKQNIQNKGGRDEIVT